MSHVMRKPVYAMCKQQRRRSAYASAQSDQRFVVRCLDSISLVSISEISRLASFWSWPGRFESYLCKSRRQVFLWRGSYKEMQWPGAMTWRGLPTQFSCAWHNTENLFNFASELYFRNWNYSKKNIAREKMILINVKILINAQCSNKQPSPFLITKIGAFCWRFSSMLLLNAHCSKSIWEFVHIYTGFWLLSDSVLQ